MAGYGRIGFRNKIWMAHRVMWTLVRGEIPGDLKVLHKCDNRPCCNPDHLWLGTQRDNMRDCVKKGRQPNLLKPGEKNRMAKLSEKQVLRMKKLRNNEGWSYKKIANEFNVSKSGAFRAIKGQRWRYLIGLISKN